MKFNIFKYIFFIIVVLLIGFAFYLIYKNGNSKSLAVEENKMQINMLKDMNIGVVNLDTLNPILSNNRDVQYLTKLIFEPLLDITKDFRIENKLAKEFSKINAKTYIVKLREDIYWHDKTKFAAEDVIFTINGLKQDNINSIYKENVKSIEKVEQIDDYTIKIILNEETPFFEYNMCFPILSSSSYDSETLVSKTEKLNGTGKYKIENIQEDLIQLVVANENYKTNIKEINILLKKTVKDLYNSFVNKELDYIITDNVDYEKYLGTMGYNVCKIPNREYEYLVLNNKKLNKNVRQAIEMIIDRDSINYNIYNNRYIDCNFPLYYGTYLYNCEDDIYYANQAKSTLIENGWIYKNNSWINNNKVLKFNLIVNEENEKRLLASEEIKKQLSNLGIDINVIRVNSSTYINYLQNKNYDMILTGNLIGNSPNLGTYFGDNNLSNFDNKEVKELLKDIKNISDEEVLKEKYLRLSYIYNEEMPFISLYSNSLFIITSRNLKGDLSCNWYNLFYNIDDWYKIKN